MARPWIRTRGHRVRIPSALTTRPLSHTAISSVFNRPVLRCRRLAAAAAAADAAVEWHEVVELFPMTSRHSSSSRQVNAPAAQTAAEFRLHRLTQSAAASAAAAATATDGSACYGSTAEITQQPAVVRTNERRQSARYTVDERRRRFVGHVLRLPSARPVSTVDARRWEKTKRQT